ncbi:unannotated protein [freshwater metagenome]|uniref:Unannotated protein n=1 Tax=freshwater metagenome TaxID=449393 RepID=A0A6J7F8X2_9ZZZZ
MTNQLRDRLVSLLSERADRVAGGDLGEASTLELIVRGESVSVRLFSRYNRTMVVALDVYVDDVVETPALTHWVATRSGVMPFAALRIDRPSGQDTTPAVLLVSHVLVAQTADGHQLDEVLDALTYMARRARGRVEEFAAALHADRSLEPADGTAEPAHGTAQAGDAAAPEIVFSDGFTRHTPSLRSRESVLAALGALIGLAPVKAEIASLVRSQEVAELRHKRGLAANTPSPHLVFVGNPGTGKTTVARLVGELYRSIGLLPQGHLVETDRAGLVAGYLGQTALKTRQVCEQALGGVLFIDEAYSLDGGERDYGSEAVDTLLTFMENHRGEMAVVVAGYPTEMHRFVQSNPGLRSRFDLTIEFPDYSLAELDAIFGGLAAQHDYDLTSEARTQLLAYMSTWPRHRGFGNGREVRKLFNEVTRRHAMLLAGQRPSTERLRTITPAAVPVPPATHRPNPHPGYM